MSEFSLLTIDVDLNAFMIGEKRKFIFQDRKELPITICNFDSLFQIENFPAMSIFLTFPVIIPFPSFFLIPSLTIQRLTLLVLLTMQYIHHLQLCVKRMQTNFVLFATF